MTGTRATAVTPALPARASPRGGAAVRPSVLSPWLLLAAAALIVTLGGLGVAALALSTPACHRVNPFDLDTADLRKLGCPDGDPVSGRRYQTQSFAGGLMILFEVGGQGPGFAGERLYALANDLRAWQLPDSWRDPGGDDVRRLYLSRLRQAPRGQRRSVAEFRPGLVLKPVDPGGAGRAGDAVHGRIGPRRW